MGHQLILNPQLSKRFVGHPIWTLSLPPNEEIQSVIPAQRGPVASVGKVLGNRSTLYKYLNPHLTAVLTSSPKSQPPICGIYLVDTVKGSLVYHVTLPSSAGVCDVRATITENWLVYSYFDEEFSGVGQRKGYRVVSVELYEGVKADDKVKRYGIQIFHELFNIDLDSFTCTVQICRRFPTEPRRLLPTNNHTLRHTELWHSPRLPQNSVSAPKILFVCAHLDLWHLLLIFYFATVASKDSKIQSLPRRFLDPRRPDRKLTNEDIEEQLIQYEPVLQNHPQRVLSHNYEVYHS